MTGASNAYRFEARPETRQPFGRAPGQIVLVGAAFALFVLSVPSGLLPLGLLFVVVLPVVGYYPLFTEDKLYRRIGRRLAFWWRQSAGTTRWRAGIPLLAGSGDIAGDAVRLPRCLAGLDIVAVDRPAWAGTDRTVAPIGIVRDRRGRELTGVLAVRGIEFELLAPAEQERRVHEWGLALAGFAGSGSPVVRLGWHEWCSPMPLSDHLEFLASRQVPDSPAAASYRELLGEVAPVAPRHELRLTVTVDPRRSRRRGRRSGGLEAVLDQLQLLMDRCEEAGLSVAAPLSPVEIAEAVRTMADPRVAVGLQTRRRRLGDRVGTVSTLPMVPLRVDEHDDHCATDSAFHRTFWVSGWPMSPVDAGWMQPLLLGGQGRTRTLTMIYEPVAPKVSRMQIGNEHTTVTSEINKKTGGSQFVPGHLTDQLAVIRDREADLNAGFAEFAYLGLVTVTGRTLEELDDAAFAVESAAMDRCGLELRSLDTRQDLAWACTLPLGRAPRRSMGAVLSDRVATR